MMWLFLHIFFLIGFRNRIEVLIDWFWAYLTRERSARLITGDPGEMVVHKRRSETQRADAPVQPLAKNAAVSEVESETAK